MKTKTTFRTAVIIALLSAAITSVSTAGDAPMISLWKDGAPGSEARRNEPIKVDGTNISNIHDPSITVYLPEEGKSTGTAIVIAPGGGHSKLCLGHEGDALAEWFAEHGIAAFVLRYRLCRS